MKRQKRVVTIQDISCYGKCSLTVALPVISAAGVEACPLPTAVLSAHTGFNGVFCRDLSEDIPKIIEHWKALELEFDVIYTGYLGSAAQIDTVLDFIDHFKTEASKVVVDPVMADNGKLYTGFDASFVQKMRGLCAKADIVLPNITESCLLCGEEFREHYDKDYIEQLMKQLNGIGAKNIVITGVKPSQYEIGAACYNAQSNRISYQFCACADGSYHGTGDIFASVISACAAKGLPLEKGVKAAVSFTAQCIQTTDNEKTLPLYGIRFEPCLLHLHELTK